MGAGYVKCVVTEDIYPIVSTAVPEAVFLVLPRGERGGISARYSEEIINAANKADAVLVGCGMGMSSDTQSIVLSLLTECDTPLLIDADGINAICKHIDILKNTTKPVVLTPHEGEMSRLLRVSAEIIKGAREAAVKMAADDLNALVVLKGKNTIIAEKGEELCVNPTGNPGMAVAGSGDVLAGMIVSMMAQGLSVSDASKAGVYLHGLAGDLGAEDLTEYSLLPTDIIDYIPKAIKKLMK